MFGEVSARITRRGTLRCRFSLTAEMKESILRKIRVLRSIGGSNFRLLATKEGVTAKLIFLARVYKVTFVGNYALLYKKRWEAIFLSFFVFFSSRYNDIETVVKWAEIVNETDICALLLSFISVMLLNNSLMLTLNLQQFRKKIGLHQLV